MRCALLSGLILIAQAAAVAGTNITLVVGKDAPALEKRVAEQLGKDLHQLFDAATSISNSATPGASVLLIGSPKTNPAIPAKDFPALSEQGHVLKSTPSGLIVGGGSPEATLWAASELNYRFGVRHLLHGDAAPIEKPALTLDGLNVVMEPLVKARVWDACHDQPHSSASWTYDDYARLVPQLARLKFTHIVLPVKSVNFPPVSVDGDTAGRTAFKGAHSFAPPQDTDLNTKVTKLAADHGIQVVPEAPATFKVIALGAAKPSVFPQFAPLRLESDFKSALAAKPEGCVFRAVIPGDLNAAAHYVSRTSFGADLSAEKTLAELVTPICGEGVSERLWMGFEQVEKASKLIDANAPDLGVPGPQMFLRHLDPKSPAPAWLTEVKTLYTGAMGEMYRGNTRARGGARPFILYHAKRMEFALHCCTTLESLHKPSEEAAELAPEAIYNALNAYADVARDSSDRGVIALLNAYGYRPILKVLSQ
jgi:hypothetical protein